MSNSTTVYCIYNDVCGGHAIMELIEIWEDRDEAEKRVAQLKQTNKDNNFVIVGESVK